MITIKKSINRMKIIPNIARHHSRFNVNSRITRKSVNIRGAIEVQHHTDRDPCKIVCHYSEGSLMTRIFMALHDAGIDVPMKSSSLHPIDQFHIGGIPATEHLLKQLNIQDEGSKVLDIGCGLGGTARYIASYWPGSVVLGIDITPEFVKVANQLTAMTSDVVHEQVSCTVANALEIPVADEEYDTAVMMHVGMNIQDKKALFSEVYRTLKPGGEFGLFDVMSFNTKESSEAIQDPSRYPVPWASNHDHSFIEPLDAYIEAAENAGFIVKKSKARLDFARVFFSPVRKKLRNDPPLSITSGINDSEYRSQSNEPIFPLFSTIRTTFGTDGVQKVSNLIKMLDDEVISPTELICVKPLLQ